MLAHNGRVDNDRTAGAGMLLADLTHRGAALWPGATAFAWAGGTRTFAELDDRVHRLAAVLAAGGVRSGSRVALLTVNTPEALETAFAASLLGACVVPLNVRLAPAEIAFQVEDAGAGHAVLHPALEGLAAASGLPDRVHWVIGADLDARIAAADPVGSRPRSDAPVMQLYTSGTTGNPKGCLLTNRGWITATTNTVLGLNLSTLSNDSERLLASLPFFHVAGYGAALGHLAVGGSVVIPQSNDLDETWTLIKDHAITTAIFVNGVQRALRHQAAGRWALRRTFGMAGTTRSESLETMVGVGFDFRGVYGSTEAGNFVTVSTLADERDHPGTIGRPLPAFDIEVRDPGGRPLPAGEVGELVLRGPSVMAGYAGLPDPMADGWLHTGDLVRRDETGRFFFVDRAKDMIKTGGENVYSAEVERVLLTHPGVADAAVVGVPDRRWGEAVKALLVTRAAVAAEELDAHCRLSLGGFKRPRWYEFVDAVPRNHSGKILKRELRAAHDPGVAVRLPERELG
jgi:fatty-acyl-CoA synthase